MSNLILLFVCLIAGVIFRKSNLFPENAHQTLNNIILYICLPALALLYIPEIVITKNIIYPLTVTYIVFGFSVILFIILGRIFSLTPATIGALILTAGLCNTSFVGFPVLITLYGEEGLKVGVLIDQAGSFVILSTLGVIVASFYSHGKIHYSKIFTRIITYPSFLAFAAGVVLNIMNYKFSGVYKEFLDKAGSPMAFLALISVGYQLKINIKQIPLKEILFGLTYKLILAPLIVYIIFVIIFKANGLDVRVSIIESAMAPMVMGSVMASSYDLNPRLANLMVGIGIPLSFITLTLWYLLIK